MTCIVGIMKDGKVYIGGDSAGVSGAHIQQRADKKVFANGPMIFGFTGSFRMGQLLKYSLRVPKQNENKKDYEYMVTDFVNAVRRCFKDNGCNSIKDGKEQGGKFLVGYNGVLHTIDLDYQVCIELNSYTAIGLGRDLALGSLFTTQKATFLTPEKRIKEALEAAAKHCSGVTEPFHILSK